MAFYEELRQRGYVEGKNLVVERRNAAGQADQLPALARELVALGPDLIVAVSPRNLPSMTKSRFRAYPRALSPYSRCRALPMPGPAGSLLFYPCLGRPVSFLIYYIYYINSYLKLLSSLY